MAYRQLYIWVEGNDDLRFFDQIVKPTFDELYDRVEVIAYANRRSENVINFVKSIKAMQADYIFIADINASPCPADRKQRLRKTFKNVDNDRIMVVIREIESWYLAGLDETSSNKLGLPIFDITDEVDKAKFDQLRPGSFDSRIDFMVEILKYFSLDTASQKNSSFKYFTVKFQ